MFTSPFPALFPTLAQPAGTDGPDPFALSLQSGLMVCSAVLAAVDIGLPDALSSEPQSVEALAQTTDTHAALTRPGQPGHLCRSRGRGPHLHPHRTLTRPAHSRRRQHAGSGELVGGALPMAGLEAPGVHRPHGSACPGAHL